MGMKLFSSSSYDFSKTNPCYEVVSPNNPDPNNYKILWCKQFGELCIVQVNYPDCKNFEGNKILVYKAELRKVLAQSTLDPHFSDSKDFLSPIARFEPTQEGSEMSQRFCRTYLTDQDYIIPPLNVAIQLLSTSKSHTKLKQNILSVISEISKAKKEIKKLYEG